MWRHLGRLLVVALLGSTLAPAAVNLAYVDLGAGGDACCLVPDGFGNIYVIGRAVSESGAKISVVRLDAGNNVTFSFTFGGRAEDQPNAAAIDPQGNLVIGGQTKSPDFPLVHALISETAPGSPAGFVTKVNPSTGQILFSTLIGGLARDSRGYGSAVSALAVDPDGNIYAAGQTNAVDFPVSANAFQKSGAGRSLLAPLPYGFVLKLSPDGDRLLYSTLLGGGDVNCSGGSHCIGLNAGSAVNAIAVDRNGIVTVGGGTRASDFPVTPGAVQDVCRCLDYTGNGFVAQFNARGSGLLWSTFLGGSLYPNLPLGTTVMALTQDAAGNILVAGSTDSDDFPTTPGVLQPKFAGSTNTYFRSTEGFLAKLNSAGTALLFSTYLGGGADDRINDLQMDAQGNILVTGNTASTDFASRVAPLTG